MTEISDIKPGDRVRLTFTKGETEHILTGPVYRCALGGLEVGGYHIALEKLAPAWHDALVIQVAGRTFALGDPGDGRRWIEVHPVEGICHWTPDDDIAALGDVEVIVDADGKVAGR